MSTAFDHFFLQTPQVYTFAATVIYLLASTGVGRAIGRPLLEGALLGFLVLIAASDLAFYIARALMLPLWVFNLLFLVWLVALIGILRRFPFARVKRIGRGSMTTAWVVGVFAMVTWGVNILTVEPAAGYSGLQATVPLFIDGSRLEGHFLTQDTWRMGHGVVGANMLYSADTAGLAAVLSLLSGLPAHPAYAGTSIASTILAFAALTGVLQGHAVAQVAFLALGLVFFRVGGTFRTFLGDNWWDVATCAAAALALVYIGRGGRLRDAAPAAVLAMAFMVFGRGYGIFFAFLLGIAGFVATRVYERRWYLGRWLIVGALSAVFAMREIIVVLRHGIYYPKPFHAKIAIPFEERLPAILGDVGVTVQRYVFDLPFPALLPALLAFVAVAYVWRSRTSFHGYRWFVALAPLGLIAVAVILELMTGYRRQTGSKLYVAPLFVGPWYPALLISMTGVDRWFHEVWERRRRTLLAAGTAAAVAITAIGLYAASERRIGQMGLAKYVEFAFESYRLENHDLQIVELIKRLPPGELEDVQRRPVLIFHSEPGIGFRYFAGGDMRMDWDFWSEGVQRVVAGADCLAQVLQRLESPNVYVSYPGLESGANQVRPAENLSRILAPMASLKNEPWVKRVVSYRYSTFYHIDSTVLARSECRD